ncbi:hypothetical protein ACFY4C_05390 [Actinomadura viridis]|uniref:hypothetical protein n=1 Tax=Actinomadura viridis TaxID=58110 RepID=UPI0036CC6E4A
MTDPMTMAIATAMAGKAVEVAGEPAREAVAAMVRKVREKFRGRAAEEAVLEGVVADPDSPERLSELHEAIRRAIAEDAAFGTTLESLWNQVRSDSTATDDGVVNNFSGQAGKVVQMRDVHGDLRIG